MANRRSLEDPGPRPMDVGGLLCGHDDGDAKECLGAMGNRARVFYFSES